MRLSRLTSSSAFVETASATIRFGCVPYATKLSRAQALPVPDILIIHSEPLFRGGVALCEIDFDFWDKLFSPTSYLNGGQPLYILCPESLVDRVWTILRLSFEGPCSNDLAAFGLSERGPWMHWRDRLAVRRSDGARVSLDEVVRILPFNESIEVLGVTIVREGPDQFSVRDQGEIAPVDITPAGHHRFPFDFPHPELDLSGQRFAFHTMGCYSGFEPGGGTTCYRLIANGLEYMIDGMSGLEPGGSRTFLLTHTHQDHLWGAMEELIGGGTLRLIAAPEVYASFVTLAVAISGCAREVIEQQISWTSIEPGETHHEYGIDISAEWVVSPVPTTGFRISVDGTSLAFSADTLSPGQMERIGLSEAEITQVSNFCLSGDLSIVDCGGAGGSPTHGLAEEWLVRAGSQKRILGTHTKLHCDGLEMARPGMARILSRL